jgi:histo-blood group ABO system transferase
MSTALLLIATGPMYWGFAKNLIVSAKQYFIQHDVILFTDSPERFDAAHKIAIPSAGYPAATLNRYHTFLAQKNLLSSYDNLFYSDVDMKFVQPVAEAMILSDGITATLHPGFAVDRMHPHAGFVSKVGTPERRPESACYIPESASNLYFCGGFNGGRASAYLHMAEQIRAMIDSDAAKGIVPFWHDESGINKFLYDNPPARILSPSFCYPEGYDGGYGWPIDEHRPVLLALNKPGHYEPVPIVVQPAPVMIPRRGGPGSKSRIRSAMLKGNRWS